MNNILENHILFYEDQIRESEQDYLTYLGTPLVQLFKSNKSHFGNITQINSKGHIILKIRKNYSPRLKIKKTFCVIRNDAWIDLGSNILHWNCECKEFLSQSKYHTIFSDIKPLYFLKNNDSAFEYLACSSIELNLFNSISKGLIEGRTIWFIMFEELPPTQYLYNLINYTRNHQSDKNLFFTPNINYNEWNPKELTYKDDVPEIIIRTLSNKGKCIIQGPPGTGKSYTISQIVKQYLQDNKTVCVTSMSNKGLIELASKSPLNDLRNNGKIKKTLLTSDEQKLAPGIQLADKDLKISSGELLCTTYYILSSKFIDGNNVDSISKYDLVIIEEASQAYLTTISAFMRLGKQCLIVGDPMQLSPIVLNEQKSDYKHWNIETLVKGLKTFLLSSEIECFRLITSFRLTEAAAKLTGLFYNCNLVSVQNEAVLFPLIKDKRLFPFQGGTLLYTASGAVDSICSNSALNMIRRVVNQIQENYPERSIAIISPFKDTIQRIQSEFYLENQNFDIVVETIDRIQGITVDYTILYFPLRNVGFALSENRFNVATSRSMSTTLIISDMPLVGFSAISGNIAKYLERSSKLDIFN